ncbi:unnamed protein product [Rhizoctonia solani]|uniref:Calpain catalytic domain-containing protein n=1 Tax=Rhizoctonia solani TaxID=456999 RepID=A0A8H3A5D9_9AGAM|nr:unnamed protein product [Rhizoctonia solani]
MFSIFDKIISPEVPGKLPETSPTAQSKVTFGQRREEVDLLCTAELEIARERCYQKVEEIIRDCRERNSRYRDIEFDLEDDQERCLYGLNRTVFQRVSEPGMSPPLSPSPSPSPQPADVLRVTQIFEEPEFFIDGASSSDVVQSDHSGNSSFMSAVSTVATVKRLIDRICVHRDQEVGVYGFLFYRNSGWVDIIIDDLLYTRIPKFEELMDSQQKMYHEDKERFNARARVGGKTLFFSRSKTENETWLPLLEKAYAKLHGDYAALDSDWDSEAVEGLTGGISNIIRVKDLLNTDRFWEEQLMNANKDRLFACVISDSSRRQVNGLVPRHAYSILEALEVNGKRFLRMRNPWGQSEWNGPWSDGSKEWTSEWLAYLPELHHKFGDDGEFLMEYKDFLRTWATIERSRLFDGGWKLSSMWLNAASRTYPCAWSYGDVSFTFSVTEDSPAILVLSQLNDRYFRDVASYNDWNMDFVVYRAGAPAKQPYTRSYHNVLWKRTVSVELAKLEKGDYVLHHTYQDPPIYWDKRKLSKVLTQEAISKSIAINFDPESYNDHLPPPDDLFGGEDLNSLEEKQLRFDAPTPPAASESSHTLAVGDTSLDISQPLKMLDIDPLVNLDVPTVDGNNSPEEQVKIADEPGPSPKEPEASDVGEVDGVPKTDVEGEKDMSEGNGSEIGPAATAEIRSNHSSYIPSPRPYYNSPPLSPPFPRHVRSDFTCNECKMHPIEGSWYRCLE